MTMDTSVSSDYLMDCKAMDQHPVKADVCFQSVQTLSAVDETLYACGTIPLEVI
jgi:hypothetical protein